MVRILRQVLQWHLLVGQIVKVLTQLIFSLVTLLRSSGFEFPTKGRANTF